MKPERNQSGHDPGVVIRGSLRATARIGFQNLLAQVRILDVLQERHHRGIVQTEKVALAAFGLGFPGGTLQIGGRKSFQTGNILHEKLVSSRSRQEILCELVTQFAQAGVHFLQSFLFRRRQFRPVQHELTVGLFHQTFPHRVADLVLFLEPLYPAEKERVHVQRIVLAAQQLHGLAFDLAEILVGICRRHIEKDSRRLLQNLPALFQRQDRVLESGFLPVLHDIADGLVLVFDTLAQGWQVIFFLDLGKRGNPVFPVFPRHQKRVFTRFFFGGSRSGKTSGGKTAHKQGQRCDFSHV